MQSEQQNSEELPSMDTMLNMIRASGARAVYTFSERTGWYFIVYLPDEVALTFSYTGKPIEYHVEKVYRAYLRGWLETGARPTHPKAIANGSVTT